MNLESDYPNSSDRSSEDKTKILREMNYAPRQQPIKAAGASPVGVTKYTGLRREKSTSSRKTKLKKSRKFPRISTLFKLLVILILIFTVGTLWLLYKAESNMPRADVLVNYEGRISDTAGTNWLLVGSDSREHLSSQQEKELSTGEVTGTGRTDTIMLFHVPKGKGKPSLISIPRDLLFDIPSNGQNKINAAYAFGGPSLLVQTLEVNTGIHIDHYMEVGFAGLAELVDDLGGVKVCLPYEINDPLAGINLPAGCQKLNGKQALGFTRSRATPRADLDRVQNQRLFLEAVLKKLASPTTFLNLVKVNNIVSKGIKSLTFDRNDHIWDLLFLAMHARGGYTSITVPTGNGINTSVGDALTWSEDTNNFFKAIATDASLASFSAN